MDPRNDVETLLEQFKSHLERLNEFDFDFLISLVAGNKMPEGRLFYDLYYNADKKDQKVDLNPQIIEKLADEIFNQLDTENIENWIEKMIIWKLDFEYNKKVTSLTKSIPQIIKGMIADKFENLWNGHFNNLRTLRDFPDEDKAKLKKFIFDAIVFHIQGDITFKVQNAINEKMQKKVDTNLKLFPPEESHTGFTKKPVISQEKSTKKNKLIFFEKEQIDTNKTKDKKKDKIHDKKNEPKKTSKK